MTESGDSSERARRLLQLMEDVPGRSNRSLRITTFWILGFVAVAAVAAVWWIIQSFGERGVPVAIAVVGGAGGVFAIAIASRLIGDAIMRASKQAREYSESSGRPD